MARIGIGIGLGGSSGSSWTPQIPVGLLATTISNTRIDLSVTYPGSVLGGYSWERSADGLTGWSVIATTGALSNFYSNIELTANTTYYYRVRAYKGSKFSIYTDIAYDCTGTGVVYHVKTAGNNANTGLSDAQAWATVAKVNSTALAAGDRVLFNRGDTWREALGASRNGSAGIPITFSAYGSGNKPIINGSNIVTGFSLVSGSWDAAVATLPNIVLVSGVRGTYKTSKANCVASGDWYWAASVLSVYYASDPTGITEAGKRNFNVSVDGDYQSFRNIKLTGNQTVALYGTKNNFDVQYCEFNKIGGYIIGYTGSGIAVVGNNSIIKNNFFSDIHNNGVTASLANTSGAVISKNIFIDCWNRLEYPSGIGTSVNCSGSVGWIIAYNFINGCNKGVEFKTGKSILCHHNIVVNSHVNGIDSFSSGASGFPNFIYNNTVIHCPSGTAGHGIAAQDATNYVKIKNNLIYITFLGINANVQGLCIAKTNYDDVDVDNNLVYKIPGSTANLYTMPSGVFVYDNIADWKTALAGTAYSGKEVHGVNADPLFVDFAGGDYHLQTGSPCINAGVDVGLTEDYEGNPIVGLPDIGAYEKQ